MPLENAKLAWLPITAVPVTKPQVEGKLAFSSITPADRSVIVTVLTPRILHGVGEHSSDVWTAVKVAALPLTGKMVTANAAAANSSCFDFMTVTPLDEPPQ